MAGSGRPYTTAIQAKQYAGQYSRDTIPVMRTAFPPRPENYLYGQPPGRRELIKPARRREEKEAAAQEDEIPPRGLRQRIYQTLKTTCTMKQVLLGCAMLISLSSFAASEVLVEKGSTKTTPGIGGNTQIGYAFAKGDIVTIDAHAEKKLERMIAYIFPENVMGRKTYTKHAKLSFTMPEDGVVVFRFISDRSGTNTIRYTVSRMPANDATQNYSTKVEWQKPNDFSGTLIPKRVEE